MPRSKPPLSLSPEQREQMERWLAAPGTPQGVARRCRIVLAAAEGRLDRSIAAVLQVSRPTVILWRQRFAEQGRESLWKIAPGRGRNPT
jgi:Homeodomain-like domain